MSIPEANLFPFARSFPLHPVGVGVGSFSYPRHWALDSALLFDLPPEDPPPRADEDPFPLPPDPSQPD